MTNGPGLVGALLVGVSFAKSLAASLGVPVIGVNHLEGHLFATALEDGAAVPPFIALLVSGGHTLLLDVPAWGDYRLLGATRDDAAGEAFDKTAKLLGLPYPGGRHIEALAAKGDPARFRFPRPMLHGGQRAGDADYYDVSFSGLKTAVLHAVRDAERRGALDEERPHLARAFQDALVETLAAKTVRAAVAHGRTRDRARRRRRVQRRARERGARARRLATARKRRAGLRAGPAPGDRQRRDDRARRALPPRARRALGALAQRVLVDAAGPA